MSRLEEIKNQLEESNSYDDNPNGYWYHNIKWLIQQAEVSKEWQIVANNTYADLIKAERRVKELEDKLYELNESAYETQIDFSEANGKKNSLLEQNQRYKQALEEILGLDIDVSIYDYAGDVITIAAEALKGDKT